MSYKKSNYLNKLIFIISIFICNSISFADITVVGKGIVEAEPDTVMFTASIDTVDKSASVATQNNAAQTDKTLKLISKLLEDPKAARTQSYLVRPEYKYNRDTNKSEFIGFKVNNTLSIKTKKLNNIGETIDSIISNGITSISNLSFSYEDSESLYMQALEKAVVNASERAYIIADNASLALGDIKDILVISGRTYSPQPVAKYAMLAEASAPSTPISAPDVKNEATVQVVFNTNK